MMATERNGLLEDVAKRAKELAEEDGEMWDYLTGFERNCYYGKASQELYPDVTIQ